MEAEADTVTIGPACHDADPPVRVGAVGGVRSICTNPFVPVQAEAFPSASSDRNSTRVAPSAEIVAADPAVGADQVLPASADVRYSYPAKPDPASAGVPVGCTITDATFAQVPEPPVSTGSDGGRVSTIASAVGSALAGAHAELLPALSSARNCTQVVPSAVTFAVAPAAAALHEAPALAELRCW